LPPFFLFFCYCSCWLFFHKKAFGAFISEPLRKTSKFYGDRECFVWRMNPTPEKYSWSEGCNDQFVFIDNNFIQIGGYVHCSGEKTGNLLLFL
jgi:hypothetical protein